MSNEQLAALIGTVLIVAYLMWALAEEIEARGGTRE